MVTQKEVAVKVYPKQLAGNVVPGGWGMTETGENNEEAKIVRETRKILHLQELGMAVTCVRVPARVGHAARSWWISRCVRGGSAGEWDAA